MKEINIPGHVLHGRLCRVFLSEPMKGEVTVELLEAAEGYKVGDKVRLQIHKLATSEKAADPKHHVGHYIAVDAWARDYGGRRFLGNGWCADCRCPVELNVEIPGTYNPEKVRK